MQNDDPFRWILVAGLTCVLPVALYHRVRSQASRETLDRRQEGWFILLTLRPLGFASIIGLLLFIIRPSLMRWSQLELPAAVRWCGVPLGALTGLLLISVFRSIGDNITDTVVTRQKHELITHGPYRYVRHPLYSATLLASVANGLVTANWFIGGCGLLCFTLLLIRSRTEERFLVDRFGEEYETYRETTGAVIPGIGATERS